ncbi:hypothetical protein AUEXF2481DRAFT_79034 [Aureobasidium subglaciale EXF-2481]|uniref:Uncharacterized protein n=1 Tax=Aureobasidium subglaciale (strain EXF-2481) TaxID=1043005 RepID=A0A074YFU3_AURSE|nr:uncharacterized protein AUEXF2481DRAFT_79034 [Aureobasidium subglaciale EXF-2481]KEQ96668.1 hypothetical protein AUEXF2481DRAFT_79034 [Aureobasidium subglaciale EXF-2481]
MQPPKSRKKTPKAHGDSAYEDSPAPPDKKTRIMLKRGKKLPKKGELIVAQSDDTVVEDTEEPQNPEDDLLTAANAPVPIHEKRTPAKVAVEPARPRIARPERTVDGLLSQSIKMVRQEMEKQAGAFDFTPDGDFPSSTRVFGNYLLNAPHQMDRTNGKWYKRACEKVGMMSMRDVMGKGVAAAVTEALVETIAEETQRVAQTFAADATRLIESVSNTGEE